MKSLLASARSLERAGPGGPRREAARGAVADETARSPWSDSGSTAVPGPGAALIDRRAHLVALIKADLRCRFERGQTAEVADYLDRFPDLREADSRIISLIYEEFCLREERGDSLDVEAFCERYPALERLAGSRSFSTTVSSARRPA